MLALYYKYNTLVNLAFAAIVCIVSEYVLNTELSFIETILVFGQFELLTLIQDNKKDGDHVQVYLLQYDVIANNRNENTS